MGASRKLQGEIDRVLKKVQEGVDVFDSIWNKVYDTDNANQKEKFEADLKKEIKKLQRYRDQIKTWIQSSEIKDKKALMDARKQIEREMERFKICEKETKTKAFSKEGLGQQPKTDPKEKAKGETRDWLNNVVSELENQIDSFEAEIEGLSVKKGKTRPPRLTHLEASISRHKAHIMKLELILRLLDNDELSPEQVNDVKDFLDDYVERNQEDFDEFSDVDELYSSLPLDKVESLEDLVTIGPPGLVKGASATSAVLNMKTSLAAVPTPPATTSASVQQTPPLDQVDETALQDDAVVRSPPPKGSSLSISAPQTPASGLAASAITSASSLVAVSSPIKEEEIANFPGRKSSPALAETGLRAIGKGGLPSQPTSDILPSSGNTIPSSGTIPLGSEMGKKKILVSDDRSASSGIAQSIVSPLGNRVILSQAAAKASDGLGSADTGNVSDAAIMGSRVFTSPVVPGMQWRPGSSFQNQNEAGQLRGRTEIAPDQREQFLQRFQQVQQQGQTNLLGMPPLAGGKQYSAQQQNLLIQQFNAQSSSISPQLGMGIGVQTSGLSSVTTPASLQSQPSAIHQASNQQAVISSISKDAETSLTKVEELRQQQPFTEDSAPDSSSNSGLGKSLVQEDELKASYALDTAQAAVASVPLGEPSQVMRETDLSPGQPLQPASLGVIGRRSVSDLGAIGDNISASTANSGGMHDQIYNLQMLEAAYYRLPQPKDSERARTYTPRHPVVTPQSYPQVQAPIVNNPAFWERLGPDSYATDMLFFSFYYQQNTYQQYLAAKELKKQSWRYHRKFNTWFQRHEEPKVATDDFEQGTYVYFDFHISSDEQQGWCQRIRTEFTFEYSFLEDDLII
ncbi:PREDICTED: general negative regulator of transcription subunit 3-like isoform X3 [Erythranthe guttata]|uniref:general negative regulator of transcription subunit 3-like isoform X3 n=1 Tax=Erythranthe guttata TaxID=4155 RepID=UPI00064D8437|nr:PREDICTED: general negative regulator of transcription subunit 3-like isoform X3 [Erythranthe guttata]|eukprot:XP_012835613.1 PREDICTED: general negative regulator of transcription subunit 3-like isoform X3 [Erythranthe guttata]